MKKNKNDQVKNAENQFSNYSGLKAIEHYKKTFKHLLSKEEFSLLLKSISNYEIDYALSLFAKDLIKLTDNTNIDLYLPYINYRINNNLSIREDVELECAKKIIKSNIEFGMALTYISDRVYYVSKACELCLLINDLETYKMTSEILYKHINDTSFKNISTSAQKIFAKVYNG